MQCFKIYQKNVNFCKSSWASVECPTSVLHTQCYSGAFAKISIKNIWKNIMCSINKYGCHICSCIFYVSVTCFNGHITCAYVSLCHVLTAIWSLRYFTEHSLYGLCVSWPYSWWWDHWSVICCSIIICIYGLCVPWSVVHGPWDHGSVFYIFCMYFYSDQKCVVTFALCGSSFYSGSQFISGPDFIWWTWLHLFIAFPITCSYVLEECTSQFQVHPSPQVKWAFCCTVIHSR